MHNGSATARVFYILGLLELRIRMTPRAAPCQYALRMRIGHVELKLELKNRA